MYLKDDSLKIIEKWRTAMLERDIEFCINGHDLTPKGGKSYINLDFFNNFLFYLRARDN